MRILVIDDDLEMTTGLRAELERYGHDTDAYENPNLVLSLDASQYTVAVIDIRTPDMNSFELARKLWQQNESMQICFLTTFDISENEAKTLLPSLKSHCFVTRPIAPNALAKHIEAHFVKDSKRAQ